MNHYVLFRRGRSHCALHVSQISRIFSIRQVMPLADAAVDVLGIIPMGDLIIPIIATPLTAVDPVGDRQGIILVYNGDSPFGFQVDAIDGIEPLIPLEKKELLKEKQEELSGVPPDAIRRFLRRDAPSVGPNETKIGPEIIPKGGQESGPESGPTSPKIIPEIIPETLYRARAFPEEP